MDDRGVIVTGATGFVGRHLIDALAGTHRIWAIARGSPQIRGATFPAGVRWLPVDISDASDVREAFGRVREGGGARIVFHLAGHFDFTGERNPEYERTNVHGTRNVLDASRELGVEDVIFASSVAACSFPETGRALDETSAPDGDTPYAESKRAGERMIREYRGDFRGWIVRLAALFSDWCEYEPLFRFIEIWLSRHPRSRVLAGSGSSAIPFLHVRDGIAFLRGLLERRAVLDPEEVLLASTDGATSHRELFETITASWFGWRSTPVFVPAPLCRTGLHVRDAIGRVVGVHVFERPWMGKYIDLRMAVDASRTRERLGWQPRPRLGVLRRIPFMIQNRKSFPAEWQRRNHVALKSVRHHENLRIHALLDRTATRLARAHVEFLFDPSRRSRFPVSCSLGTEQGLATSLFLIEALVDAVRTGEKTIFRTACADLARQRQRSGAKVEEVAALLDSLGDLCVLDLAQRDPSRTWSLVLYDHVTMTIQYGIDEAHEEFDR